MGRNWGNMNPEINPKSPYIAVHNSPPDDIGTRTRDDSRDRMEV